VEDLRETVALLCYECSHATVYERGTSAFINWLEHAIYQFHGFQLEYTPEKSMDLEALTNPLFSRFLKNYKEFTKVLRL
jgi:hypothetical protein